MLRWGILGSGFISNTVIESIALSDDSEVGVVAGRNLQRATDMAARHGIEHAVDDHHQVLADPSIDAVYIGLPNHLHHELVCAAAAAGKSILSEKSLTTTMDTAHQLIDAVRSHQVFFVEGLMYLAHPVIQLALDVIADGRLGPIRSINARYAANIWQVVNPLGRGTIYNLGCYPVSLLQLVMQAAFGDTAFAARTMVGAGNTTGTLRGTPDGTISDAALTVRFDNGVLASVQSSDSYGNVSDFSITGDNGMLSFRTNPWLPQPGSNGLIWQPFDTGHKSETFDIEDPHDAFYHQVKMVERCVRDGHTQSTRPSPTWADSIAVMSMLTEWEQLCLRR